MPFDQHTTNSIATFPAMMPLLPFYPDGVIP
jgi:hypothetical protein